MHHAVEARVIQKTSGSKVILAAGPFGRVAAPSNSWKHEADSRNSDRQPLSVQRREARTPRQLVYTRIFAQFGSRRRTHSRVDQLKLNVRSHPITNKDENAPKICQRVISNKVWTKSSTCNRKSLPSLMLQTHRS